LNLIVRFLIYKDNETPRNIPTLGAQSAEMQVKLKVNLKSDYIKTILFLILMIGSVFAFWYGLKAVLKTEYPLLAVASGSMTPTLNVGDLIVVQGGLEAPYNEINVDYTNGTIIVFQGNPIGKPGELIVHRAVDKDLRNGVWYFTTHGDNNPKGSEERFSEEDLVGKVVGYIPLIGHIPLFVREPSGMIIILVLMLILIFAEFLPIWKKKTQPSENAPLSETVP